MFEINLPEDEVGQLLCDFHAGFLPSITRVFSHASDRYLDHLGIGSEYANTLRLSTFSVQEDTFIGAYISLPQPLAVRTMGTSVSEKKLGYVHVMNDAAGKLVAKQTVLSLHVSLETRRTLPFPDEQIAKLRELVAADTRLPVPQVNISEPDLTQL